MTHASDGPRSDRRLSLTVPFTLCKASTYSREQMVCDHCENFMRYHLGTRSFKALNGRMLDDSTSTMTLTSLSFALALRSCGQERTSPKRVDSHVRVTKSQARIFQELMRRRGLEVPAPPRSSPTTPPAAFGEGALAASSSHMVAISILDYIPLHGNPLVNGHRIVASRRMDQSGLCVLAPGPFLETGLYELASSVSGGWASVMSDPMPSHLQDLRQRNVDDLHLLTVVKDLVAEYGNRRKLLQGVGGLRARQPPRAASSKSGGSFGRVASLAPVEPGTPRGAPTQVDTTPAAKVRSRCSRAMSPRSCSSKARSSCISASSASAAPSRLAAAIMAPQTSPQVASVKAGSLG